MDQSKDKKKPSPGEIAPKGNPSPPAEALGDAGNPFPWDTPARLPTPDAVDLGGQLPSWLDIGLAESELAKFEHEIIKRESESEIALPPAAQTPTAESAETGSSLAPAAPAAITLPAGVVNLDDLPLPPEVAAPESFSVMAETPIPELPRWEATGSPPDEPPTSPAPELLEESSAPALAPVLDVAAELVAAPADGAALQPEAGAEVESRPPWEQPIAAEATFEAPAAESARILDEMVAAIDAGITLEAESSAPAAPAASKPWTRTAEEQLVVFTLGGVDYGVAIANLREVGRMPAVTPVPNVPSWVLGVANIRGDVVSLVDLRAFLGLEPYGRQTTARMLVARDRQEEVTAGLVVDQVKGIRYVTADRINPAASPIEDRVAPYLRGFTEQDGRLLVLLDLNRLLLSPEMRQFEPI